VRRIRIPICATGLRLPGGLRPRVRRGAAAPA
jgi:hypothetical protein